MGFLKALGGDETYNNDENSNCYDSYEDDEYDDDNADFQGDALEAGGSSSMARSFKE